MNPATAPIISTLKNARVVMPPSGPIRKATPWIQGAREPGELADGMFAVGPFGKPMVGLTGGAGGLI